MVDGVLGSSLMIPDEEMFDFLMDLSSPFFSMYNLLGVGGGGSSGTWRAAIAATIAGIYE